MNSINKHAVITGGSNGIGRFIAESFLREGAAVTVIDIDKREHEGVQFFHGDIADKAVLEAFVNSLTRPVDYLINNACIGRSGLLSLCSYEDFEYVQRVGVTAPYYLTSLLLQKDLFTENAAIVNISSTRANQSQPDTEAYSAAKGAINALTHAMAISLAGKVRVNAISPAWIETSASTEHSEQDNRQHPSGRVGTPVDIAEVVLYLCSDKAGFINGENIAVDGGMSKLMIYHDDYGWKLT
jgi:NAD(P)-dependent dehydrogenase (short-subunit alcohol dehydrogenase family)